MKHTTRILLTIILLTLLIATPLFALGSKESTPLDATLQFVDSRGVTSYIVHPVSRIVSMSPNVTESIAALGMAEALVGRTDYCDYPAEIVNTVPSVGDLFTPSVEKIVSLEPDFVIFGTLGHETTISALEQAGLQVVYLDESSSMEGTYWLLETIGELLDRNQEASTVTAAMRQEVEEVGQRVASLKAPSVYYVAGFGEWGDFTATGDTYIDDLITLAGGKNIAADAFNWGFQLELLIERDPEIIILPPSWGSTFEETRNLFVTTEGYNSLTAVKTGQVFPFESGLLERQSPRSSAAVRQLSEIFHP